MPIAEALPFVRQPRSPRVSANSIRIHAVPKKRQPHLEFKDVELKPTGAKLKTHQPLPISPDLKEERSERPRKKRKKSSPLPLERHGPCTRTRRLETFHVFGMEKTMESKPEISRRPLPLSSPLRNREQRLRAERGRVVRDEFQAAKGREELMQMVHSFLKQEESGLGTPDEARNQDQSILLSTVDLFLKRERTKLKSLETAVPNPSPSSGPRFSLV
jgi:hypothetical protein